MGLHVDTLRWQIHNGKLKAHKVGPLWVVSRRSLEKYRAEAHAASVGAVRSLRRVIHRAALP